jgi:hypothetical protein
VRGWLGLLFGKDDTRRMLVAFAIAVALHEIVAGLIPPSRQAAPPEREIVTRVTVARVLVRPTPTPLPPPTPHPVIPRTHHVAALEVVAVAASNGASARKEIVHRVGAARPRPPRVQHAKPIWDIPLGGQGAGAGKATGAGSLGSGGSGTGAAGNGNGSGGEAGTQPCGFVTFMDPHGARYDSQTHGFWVDVQMSVHFPDGHNASVMLDYPWYYPNSAANPFENEQVPMLFQWPPADKTAGEPDLVQYVMQHSAQPGITLLKDCP